MVGWCVGLHDCIQHFQTFDLHRAILSETKPTLYQYIRDISQFYMFVKSISNFYGIVIYTRHRAFIALNLWPQNSRNVNAVWRII